MIATSFRAPDSGGDNRSEIVSAALSRASALDFHDVKFKLNLEHGRPLPDCDITTEYLERQYRQFLAIQFAYPDETIVPTEAIDKFWHSHILDTRAYARDCEAVFGYFLHHYPYFGINGPTDRRNLDDAFRKTCVIWFRHFGVELDKGHGDHCSSSCSRCSSCNGR